MRIIVEYNLGTIREIVGIYGNVGGKLGYRDAKRLTENGGINRLKVQHLQLHFEVDVRR